jgi:hypothetical protein
MKKAIDRTKAAFHRQTATEDIDSDKTEGDELKQGSETRYGFDVASVMAWPVRCLLLGLHRRSVEQERS